MSIDIPGYAAHTHDLSPCRCKAGQQVAMATLKA